MTGSSNISEMLNLEDARCLSSVVMAGRSSWSEKKSGGMEGMEEMRDGCMAD